MRTRPKVSVYTLLEALLHPTAKRQVVKYPVMSRMLGKMPRYLRRAAIEHAYGAVSSFQSKWTKFLDGKVAAAFGAKVFVIEDLKGWRPKGPSKAQEGRSAQTLHGAGEPVQLVSREQACDVNAAVNIRHRELVWLEKKLAAAEGLKASDPAADKG